MCQVRTNLEDLQKISVYMCRVAVGTVPTRTGVTKLHCNNGYSSVNGMISLVPTDTSTLGYKLLWGKTKIVSFRAAIWLSWAVTLGDYPTDFWILCPVSVWRPVYIRQYCVSCSVPHKTEKRDAECSLFVTFCSPRVGARLLAKSWCHNETSS